MITQFYLYTLADNNLKRNFKKFPFNNISRGGPWGAAWGPPPCPQVALAPVLLYLSCPQVYDIQYYLSILS